MKAIRDLIAWLDGADHDICRLCKRVNPQHLNCTSCQEHDDRQEVIKAGNALPDWPRVSREAVRKVVGQIYSWNRWGTEPPGPHGQELFDLLRSIGVEIKEKKDHD